MLKKKFSIVLILLIFMPNFINADIIQGKVKVIDGDTVKIKNNKIRLSGIDAPELNQLCSKVFLSLSFISFNKKYYCGKISTEKLKRLIKNEIILCKVENLSLIHI